MSEFTDGTTKFVVTKSLGVLPGTVTAFSGEFNDGFPIDKNTGLANREWHLCDGTNGTPDLRNRFIYGGDGKNNGATGGEASHTLTEAELPIPLNHLKYSDDAKFHPIWESDLNIESVVVDRHLTQAPLPHNNMPPYFVLAFIMKL